MRNPLASAALASFSVTWSQWFLNHAREWCPIWANGVCMGPQCGPHCGLDAIDMDVPLILRAAINRIGCQAELIAPENPAGTLVDIPTGVPRLSPIIRRTRRQDCWVLDPGYTGR